VRVSGTDDQSTLIGSCIDLLLTQIRPVDLAIVYSTVDWWKSGGGLCISEGRRVTLLVIVAQGPSRLSGRYLAERNDWTSDNGSAGREKSDIFKDQERSASKVGIERGGDPPEP